MAPTRSLLTLILSVSTLSACTNQPEPIKPIQLYSNKETVQMSYCAELADMAYLVASQKLQDQPKQSQIDRFASGTAAQIKLNLVEDVYAADFTSAWNYSVDLFDQCAVKVANIPAERLNVASFCAQKSLVAGGAYDLKQAGAPKLDAYMVFASYKATKPYEVIDAVYKKSSSHDAVTKKTWDSCIDILAE
ncbi:hypothetical protein RN22_08005 [Grimontia sp. AD028]|uniref:hypothetical protein n=1 Tax=Grimontia sp. AD028 TaxID=1581149 RepID=UPI00061ADF4A|nr:hypothetical protein [Grimontia sp. AD028]KKD60980.1 hypothetical protein RN22_08005 [Grimontia sp. AD028]